jgi:Cu/Ag efflux protein CusF
VRSVNTGLPISIFLLVPAVLFGACGSRPHAVENATTPTPQSSIVSNANAVEKTITPTPQSSSATNPLNMPSPILNHPYPGTGIVKTVNRKEGWIGINHEEIAGYMPAMEMEFWVKSRKLLDNIEVGDRVDFVVVETGKIQHITKIKKKP